MDRMISCQQIHLNGRDIHSLDGVKIRMRSKSVNTLCDAGQICELYAVWKKTDGSLDTHNIIHDDGMFNGSIELEGQNGTGFSRDHVDSEYGRIDKEGQPGYFTNRYK